MRNSISAQTDMVLDHLRGGPITPLDALKLYGCFRLAARVYDLRKDGHDIITQRYTTDGGAVVAEYHLLGQAHP